MDKRSFGVLVTVVAASMVIIGTYKIAKKKNQAAPVSSTPIAKPGAK
jgi:hypothetical protein